MIIHLSLMGSEQSRAKRRLEEHSGIAERRQTAGPVAVTGSRCVSFLKSILKATFHEPCMGTPGNTGALLPVPPKPPPHQQGHLQGCPSPTKPGRKKMEFRLIWGHLPKTAPFSSFLQLSRQQRSAGRHCAGEEADFSTTIEITGPFSYTVIFLFRALNTKE